MLLLSPRFAVCLWLLAAVCDAGRNKKVRLADVSTLTLSSAKQTQTKLPQLLCDYGCNAKKGAVVNQAQCKSQGLDDMGDVQWECDALMPKGCRFVETEVKCEMVDDDHIVPGSCLLQYALECDRVHASSREETELRQSIVRQKTKMQQATATEANRIKTQAAQDNCELARAAARYQVGGDPVDAKQEGGGTWAKGRVASIGCDGRYNIQLDNGRIVRGWEESKVRLHQATITRTEDVYDDVYVPDQRQHATYDHGYTHSSSADDMMGGSVPGIALVVLVLLVVALVLSGACNQRITEGAVIALFMQTPGHRLQRFALQAHFSSALARDEKNNSQDEQAKLDDIVRHVSERAMIQGGEVFLLRQDIILRENRKQAMEAEAARRRQMADAHGANRGGSTGPMAGRGGQVVRQRVGTRVVADEVSTERARAARENVLAAQAKLRVAAVKAKQDAAESARVREFQTKMDQLNRELQADTSQLGNAMARYDRVMEQYKATGYATTGEY